MGRKRIIFLVNAMKREMALLKIMSVHLSFTPKLQKKDMLLRNTI